MIFLPPQNISTRDFTKKSIFLAGSIEMGIAEHWQDKVASLLKDKGFNVFNPRRVDWDSSWTQNFTDPQFSQQVNWEMDALDKADIILFYFDPVTKSPITLLELGAYAKTGKCLVCCPEGYWRKGNVDIFCERHNVPQFDSNINLVRYILQTNS